MELYTRVAGCVPWHSVTPSHVDAGEVEAPATSKSIGEISFSGSLDLSGCIVLAIRLSLVLSHRGV